MDSYKRSFLGRIPSIFKKLPAELALRSEAKATSWTKVKKRARLFLTGKLEGAQTSRKSYRKQVNFDWNEMHKEMKEKEISITTNQNQAKFDWNPIRKEITNNKSINSNKI